MKVTVCLKEELKLEFGMYSTGPIKEHPFNSELMFCNKNAFWTVTELKAILSTCREPTLLVAPCEPNRIYGPHFFVDLGMLHNKIKRFHRNLKHQL